MIAAGTLTEIITLQSVAVTRNSIGEEEAVWRDIITTRANAKFLKGSRALLMGDVWNPCTVVFTTRYSPSFDATQRVIWNNKKYTVVSANPDRINGTVTITADLYNEGQQIEEL